MSTSLLGWTKLVLVVSALVNFVLAVILFFVPSLVHSTLWPPPFEPQPDLWLRYNAVLGLALGIGALAAMQQDSWPAARIVLIISGVYVALCVVLTLVAAATPPGVPPIAWVYVVLAVLYLPQVLWVGRQQSARAGAARL